MTDLENQCNPLQEDDKWCKYISGLFKNFVFFFLNTTCTETVKLSEIGYCQRRSYFFVCQKEINIRDYIKKITFIHQRVL